MWFRAQGLTKSFRSAAGTLKALDGLEFQIQPQERVALIGESGSGKTTLLRHLNGMLTPSEGELWVDDQPLSRLKSTETRRVRQGIAMIHQQHYLVPSLPVFQNVLAGKLGRWSHAHAIANFFWPKVADLTQAEDALALVEMADKLHARTRDLSGGQQQRVAIARALIQDPAVILADEPVASLDPALTEEIMGLLVSLCEREGKTLIASLHDISLARRYFPRVLALRQGRIVFDGPSDQLSEAWLEAIFRPAGSPSLSGR